MIINEREIHQKTIERYGVNNMINKTIQELLELAEALRDYKNGVPDAIDNVFEERVDVEKMLNKLDVIFNFDELSLKLLGVEKMKRTLDRLEPGNDYTFSTD